MKKLIIILGLVVSVSALYAQPATEAPKDSIDYSRIDFKKFGDFILSSDVFTPIKLPQLNFKDMFSTNIQTYAVQFNLDPKITFGVGMVGDYFTSSYGLYNGFFSYPEQVQMGSFQLNDNVRLNTYGHYNSEGWKVRHPYNPWDKNSFMGGMELKINKNFGIRMEVRRSNNPLYHPY